MEHKWAHDDGEIVCREAQAVLQDCKESFAHMRSFKPRVDQALAAHSRNALSEASLKKILLGFADAQTDYTNSFRRVIGLMEDDDNDEDDFFTKPMLAISEYSECGSPPPYEEVEQDMGITYRQNPGLRRRASHGGNNSAANNSSRPTTQNACGGGAGYPPGGDNPGDHPSDNEAEHHFQQQGCCRRCLRAVLSSLSWAFFTFVDLVKMCLKALWDFICYIGGKIMELANMILQMIAGESHRLEQNGALLSRMI